MVKAIRAASLQAPTSEKMAFLPTQSSFSEVAHVAVINGKAISSSDSSEQAVLQSRHEVRLLPKRLDFGMPYHEIYCNATFRNVR
jgi:hypothetical protein